MKRAKILGSLLLSLSLIFSTVIVQAKTNENNNEEIKENAKSSAFENMNWDKVLVENIKNVYDFNNKLVAYSVDIENQDDSLKGYELIDADTNKVLEFSKEKVSPYDKVAKGDTCLYNGFLNYYSKNYFNKYYDLKNYDELNEEEVENMKELSTEKERNLKVKDNNFSNKMLAANNSEKATEKVIYDVPDEIWYKGCAPTAIAMVLGYDYYDNTPEFRPLVDILAPAIGTNSKGETIIGDNVIKGIKSTMKRFDVPNVWCQIDTRGKNNSTYNEYVREINGNHPVVAMFWNSKYVTNGYPNGFGNHSTAGVGYKYTNRQQFLVLHDDAMDGEVYCDFNASTLGDNQWLYIH